jgi:CBS domain-containing protein
VMEMTKPILAGEIMTKEVITVKADDDLEKVSRLLLEHRISGLPVIDDDGKVVGIISEGDLLIKEKEVEVPGHSVILGAVIYLNSLERFYNELKRVFALTVKELMTTKVYTVKPEATTGEISNLLVEKGINRVPVVDNDNKLLGIVTRHDLIRSISDR